MASKPGADFLRVRLERCEALPAAQRAPEVTAFIQGSRLHAQICEELPLTSDGAPALPANSPRSVQLLLLSMLRMARVDYLCPVTLSSAVDPLAHIRAYLPYAEQEGSITGAWQPLLSLAKLYTRGVPPERQHGRELWALPRRAGSGGGPGD